jgi:protoporphyrinogen oxidase
MKVAIVGAGAGGLAAAYDLARSGHEVTIFEAADQVGGLASGFKAEGWDWSVERYYHHWFASDRFILGLIDELGWKDKIRFPWPVTAVYDQGSFYPLDGPLSRAFPRLPWLDNLPGAGLLSRALWVFKFPGLSLIDTLRYGWMGVSLLLAPSWKPFEQVTADEWLRRRAGERAYRTLWEPLLVGKFGPHYKEVNMAWFWARVKARTPRLGTFEGGFQAFMDAFAERVRAEGVTIQLHTAVNRIRSSQQGGLTITAGGTPMGFDQCLVTTSPDLLAKLTPELPATYLDRLTRLRSMGAVIVVLALSHQLSESGYYWHNLPKAAGFPFLALVEHTNFVPADLFGGEHIVYCGDYLDPDHEYFRLEKNELLKRFIPALTRFNSKFRPDWIRRSWLFRTPYAQPIPPVNHSQAIPDLRTPIPGLWLASMSQVYPWDRGTNFAVEVARRAVRRMLEGADRS